MLQKSGKIRSLMKELKTKYDGDEGAKQLFPQPSAVNTPLIMTIRSMHPMTHLPRCTDALKKQVANLDGQHDNLQEVWTTGEAQGFMTEKLLVYKFDIRIWLFEMCRSC